AGALFSGVLCGRATWAGSVKGYMENGEDAAREWLRTEGKDNIEALNEVLKQTAVPWTDKK
ncbi:MAG: tagatose-bisphosphate aldolase, partial [Erysipelotrichaceae bacterium]|nr:tagatose-bisphosphate aldolase [Erysipelotrichaceae bacterium]